MRGLLGQQASWARVSSNGAKVESTAPNVDERKDEEAAVIKLHVPLETNTF